MPSKLFQHIIFTRAAILAHDVVNDWSIFWVLVMINEITLLGDRCSVLAIVAKLRKHYRTIQPTKVDNQVKRLITAGYAIKHKGGTIEITTLGRAQLRHIHKKITNRSF